MKITKVPVGALQTNCYIVSNEKTKEAFVIDPGHNYSGLYNKIDETGCRLVAVLLTHAHFDHILGLPGIKERYNVPVYCLDEEKEVLSDPYLNGTEVIRHPASFAADGCFSDGEETVIAGIKLKVLATPGHTKGSACFYIEDEKVLFSGDTLFNCGIGRTDLATGDPSSILRSIAEKLLVLPADTEVFPGHGPETTIGDEKENNPFF